MICLHCDSEEFNLKPDAVIPQEYKGESLDIQTPAMACAKCGWLTLTLDQLDQLRWRTANAYELRKKQP